MGRFAWKQPGKRHDCGSARRLAVKTAAHGNAINHAAVLAECSAAYAWRISQHDGSTALQRNLLEPALGAETNVMTIGREEGIGSAFGSGEHLGFGLIERANCEAHNAARVLHRVDHVPAVGREDDRVPL